MMHQSRMAIFDVDGTLSKPFLPGGFITEAAGRCIAQRMGEGKILARLQQVRDQQKSMERREFEWSLIQIIMFELFPGLEVKEVRNILHERILNDLVSPLYLIQPIFFLLQTLHQEGYKILAPSGAFHLVLELLFETGRFPFTHFQGSELAVEDGRFTNEALHRPIADKVAWIESIREKYNYTWADSYGFGDSGSDIGFLQKVTHPVAVNPTAELQELAGQKNWPIFWPNGRLHQLSHLPSTGYEVIRSHQEEFKTL